MQYDREKARKVGNKLAQLKRERQERAKAQAQAQAAPRPTITK